MNKQNKISLILGVLVLTVLIVTSSFAFFQITNTDSSTSTNFTGETEGIEDYGKSVLSGGIEGYHINILASDMAPSKIGTHYYGTIDPDSNYSLEKKNYEISNVSIIDGVNNENVAYTCTSELSITLEGSLTQTKEDGTYYIQEGDGTLYLSGSNLKIDKRQIDLKEIISSAASNEEGIKEYKKTLTYIISKGNNGTLNVDFDIVNRDTVQNDIAGKNIEITLRNSNLQCEVSGRKVYAKLDNTSYSQSSLTYRSDAYRTKVVSASFVDYVPSEEELNQKVTYWDLTDTTSHYGYSTPANSVIGWLEPTTENPEQYNLYIGSKDIIYATDLSYAFSSMTNLKEINFDNLNTSETTNMSGTFYDDRNLTTLDLSTFDTSQVNDMSRMFYYTSVELPFNNWPKFVTTNVENMSGMFSSYQGESLDLSSFDTSSVINMSDMFGTNYYTDGLIAKIIFSKNFGSVATDMSGMFGYYKGTTLDLSNFNTSKVTDMSEMFAGNSIINLNAKIIFSKTFDTSEVTNMSNMFSGYKGTTLDLSSFDTSSVTNMNNMFSDTSLELPFKEWPNFVTNNVENMSYMFYNYKGTTLDLSSFDTSQVTIMTRMFYNCINLTTLDLSSFTFDKVTTEGENNAGNYQTFYIVPSSCQVKIKINQLETFKSKFPLNDTQSYRQFKLPDEE